MTHSSRSAPTPPPEPPRRTPWRRLRGVAAAAAALAALAAGPAAAQEGEVSGTVVSSGSQAPVAGAVVSAQGTARRASTDAAGRFRLTGLPAGQVTLQVTSLGYRAASRTVSVGDRGVRIALTESAINLDALVVTGTAGGTEKRALGNAIATVDAARVVETAPISNVQQLLNGRVAGLVIQPGTGAVGSGARIRIRGASSFSLSNEPLIYVDGVRIANAAATGPANQGFASSSISRLNDINPEEIESIEVLKGPAAATLYGTEASNGVIQIITKKGAAGNARWNLTVRQGVNYLRDPEGRFWTNYQVIPGTGKMDTVTLDMVERENAAGRPIFRNGHHQQYELGVSGGSERFRYYASGGLEDSEGAEASNDLRRYSARLNLNLAPTERLDVGLSAGYVDGQTNLSAEAGFGGRVWSTVLADARNLKDPFRRGFHSGTPEAYDALYNFGQGVNRLTGALNLNHRPFGWLAQRLSFGVDRTREDNEILFPRIDSLNNAVFGSEALGLAEVNARNISYRTLDYSATGSFDLTESFRSSTSVGAQYYRTKTDSVYAHGEVFPAPGLTAVAATTTNRRTDGGFIEEATLGLVAQQQVGWKDRVFLTAALRADDNSAFGENFDRVYYPKLSAAWVVSDESFLSDMSWLNTLKLRGAYGETGRQPQTYAALRTYAPAIGPGDSPAVTPQFIGNPDLGPERGAELELGFDAGFLQDRLGLEFTWYRKTTEDAILEREIAPSGGFSGFQFFNAGEVRNTGMELLARARALQRERLSWDLSLSVSTNDNEVVSLGGTGLNFVTAGSFLRHQVGYPLGSFFERRVVSARYDPASRLAVDVMCDDGQGSTQLCTGADLRYGTADDAPLVYLGRSLPNLEGAVTSTVTLFSRLQLYALVDFKRGHRKVDGNTRVRCTFFDGRCRENFFPAEFDPRRIAAIQSSRNLVDFLIDDASFTKLREVSVAYTLPDGYARRMGAASARVSLAGRNLYTWTGYGGLEPEAMFLGGSRGGNFGAFEQTTLPQLSQWIAAVNLTF